MTDGIVGRRRERDVLRGWRDGARQGAGRLILCGGEPGIGGPEPVGAPEITGIEVVRGYVREPVSPGHG